MIVRTTLFLLSAEVDHLAPRLTGLIRTLARKIDLALLHPYHPERHYMRGPGPRWHAKHGQVQTVPGDEA